MDCAIMTVGGNVPGAGGGDPLAFSYDFQTVNAAVNTTTLATCVPNGARVNIREISVQLQFIAGIPAGDIGQVAYCALFQAQRSTTDAQVVPFYVGPWGPPPAAALQPLSCGYQPPLLFGVGGVPVAFAIAGSNVNLVGTGIGGFTIQWNVRGRIEVFGGAVRVI